MLLLPWLFSQRGPIRPPDQRLMFLGKFNWFNRLLGANGDNVTGIGSSWREKKKKKKKGTIFSKLGKGKGKKKKRKPHLWPCWMPQPVPRRSSCCRPGRGYQSSWAQRPTQVWARNCCTRHRKCVHTYGSGVSSQRTWKLCGRRDCSTRRPRNQAQGARSKEKGKKT